MSDSKLFLLPYQSLYENNPSFKNMDPEISMD
jgi:hypothetical protein